MLTIVLLCTGVSSLFTIDPIAQQHAYLKASNTGANDNFGQTAAISGNTIVIGAPLEDSAASGVNGNQADNSLANSGAAYVFVRNGSTWSQQAYLKASNPGESDRFGTRVAIFGDTIVVGAPLEDSAATGVNGNQGDNSAQNAGAVYVFVRNGTTWTQQTYLKNSTLNPVDPWNGFGDSVSISGDTIVVGADAENSNATGVNGNEANDLSSNSGAAYVFVRNGTVWSQQAYLKASNTGTDDLFGWCVSISGNTIVVGALGEDSNATTVNGNQANDGASSAGAAYVFVRNGSTWSQQAYLKASNAEVNDRFGQAVSISGHTIVVGAWEEDSTATGVNGDQTSDAASRAGAAYVFVRSGTTWSQQAYLKASNTATFDAFGENVCVEGDLILVGALGEDSNATGVNGDQSNNGTNASGAVYAFWRTGLYWNQHAYLKASNTQTVTDFFGSACAASANDFVIGAMLEDSSATGVNGDQSNDGALGSGAAYVFEFDPPYSSFCSGDGSLPTPCPCTPPNTVPSPPAAPGHGCANSLDLNGAILSASGATSPDALKLTAHVSWNYAAFAFLMKGSAQDVNGVASSDGIRCVDGSLLRFGSHFAGTNGDLQGQWRYPNAVQTTPISIVTLQSPAQTAYYQLFYRNAAPSFCTAATANWSSGIVVPWP